MIVVVFNKPDFEYDVHSCSRSSSHRRTCRCTIAAHLMRWRKNLACTHHEMTDAGVKEFADASQVFKIDYVGKRLRWSGR